MSNEDNSGMLDVIQTAVARGVRMPLSFGQVKKLDGRREDVGLVVYAAVSTSKGVW